LSPRNKRIILRHARERLHPLYSHRGRPSVDPEVLLHIILIGYLHGITSERRLCEEVAMHLAYRWFTGLGLDQSVPNHSTFSKNRHARFSESELFRDLFEEIVRYCMAAGHQRVSQRQGLAAPVRSSQSVWQRGGHGPTFCANRFSKHPIARKACLEKAPWPMSALG
jgi:hypothetical protein